VSAIVYMQQQIHEYCSLRKFLNIWLTNNIMECCKQMAPTCNKRIYYTLHEYPINFVLIYCRSSMGLLVCKAQH